MLQKFKELQCKLFGHKWDYYMAESCRGAMCNLDFEQSGHCRRCGCDTHGKWEEN